MGPSESTSHDEVAIRQRIDAYTNAIRAKDLDAVMSNLLPDFLSYDLAPPLLHRADVYRKGLADWFPSFTGRIGLEVRDLSITAGSDVAFCHSINHLTGKRTSGEETDVWLRSTVCLRKVGGAWRIAHEHQSVPFYMDGSYKAAVDLRP